MPYTCKPILPHFAATVEGFSLDGRDPLPAEVVARIKDDMKHYRVLVFKGQGRLSGERQVQISKQLGTIESTFYKHPKSPHPDIFRVSNDEREGCVGVGRTGWHIDGTFQWKPFKYQTMHFHSVCEGGETWFVPLKEFYEMQDQEIGSREYDCFKLHDLGWDKYWMVSSEGLAHPLVYRHPVREDTSMMFHCGPPFCAAVAVDSDGDSSKRKAVKTAVKLLPPHVVQEELTQRLDDAVEKIGIKMSWEEGDFAINDNLGNCHYASPGTQNSKHKAGLRILHRTTVAGEDIPAKFDGRASFQLDV
ncbi:unnamed protein product [Durusdinium trenchii]|uniref:TauD/TfdA-like domain-containing protein n=2 Tax=Durusdinium trenchii TaxID=1381693 RepID=A0ABP0IQA8_9DINO